MRKTVLITGAGTGIGKATAIRLSNDGYQIILVGRSTFKLESCFKDLKGDGHKIASVDVGDKDNLRKAISEVMAGIENLHAVFANAGIGGENHYGADDRWDEIMQTNISGAYNTIMECLPYLKASQSEYTHAIITGSCLSRFAVPNQTAYITSKTAINGLTKALAIDLAPKKILVNAILPGWVKTEMAEQSIQKIADHSKKTYEQAYNEQMGYVPLQKMSEPAEIADLFAYLISGSQTSITGQSIDINNGAFMI